MNLKWQKFSDVLPDDATMVLFTFEDNETVADNEVCLGHMSSAPEDIDDGQVPMITNSGIFFYGTKSLGKWIYVKDILLEIM